MIIAAEQSADRIRLIAIEMKGALGNEGALPLLSRVRNLIRNVTKIALDHCLRYFQSSCRLL